MNNKFPSQPQLNFISRDATPEEIEEWQNEASDYHETVKNVMGAVIAGSFFQFFTLGSMILAFYMIDLGLDGGL
ncbi:hypothetical protein OAG26_00855 [Flavobacteriales bacterium]|jgi:hypothetical protein|nr:hypothetical protein [Flavobacteriales bacterium]|tara:strand:- start:52 stop:273 length:222 start_codon:yes stop_codon:yes gene_type:complete